VAGDQGDFVALARASVGLHHPWYTMPTTPEAFQAYLTHIPPVDPHPTLPAR